MQRLVQSLQQGDLHFYLIVGGLALVVIALIFYFLPLRRLRVPAIFACSVGTLAAGFGLGVVTLLALGYEKAPSSERAAGNESAPGGGRAGRGGGAPGGGMARGGAPGDGGGRTGRGGRGSGSPEAGARAGRGRGPAGPAAASPTPTARTQLADLVTKLDLLTNKKLAADLTKDEKALVAKQLAGLEQSERALSEQEAKTRLDLLLGALQKHKQTLLEAGFRWPGETAAPPPAEDANPFQDKTNAEHLKSLQKAL